MIELHRTLEQIYRAYSGEAACQTIADLSRFHRIQASPGYRQAAHWIGQSLIRDGLEAEVLPYAADECTQFWAMPSFQEWHCADATLRLVEPLEEAQVLADFRASPHSIIQRSTAFSGDADVVLLEDGVEEADYEGLDVAGKVVLTRGDVRRVWELAVDQREAAGILFDGMRVLTPVRPEGDLADARQYTSFWWQAGDTRCFGFVLTPHQGQVLRRLLKTPGTTVRVRGRVTAQLYDGTMEVVSAAIPGESDDEIVVVAHLCHPQPSANDNASGSAAILEAARTLQALIAAGALPRPRRTIRFLWVPEINGLYPYLLDREAELDKLVAGVNLDMVGQDQNQTGSSWLIERPPEAAASFAPDLLARLRDELPALKGMADVAPSHTGLGAYPLYRQAEVPFSGGSDHYVFSDPSVGVPTPMLIQWPDRFYHTSADTPDRSDPHSLARAGSLAAAYAYWLAAAGSEEASWLGHEMVARFKARLVETAQAAVTAALALEEGEALVQATARLDRRLAFLLDRQAAALATLERLAPIDGTVAALQAEAQGAARHEMAWARACIEEHVVALGLEALPELPPRELSEQEREASALIPLRQVKGPIPLGSHLRRLDADVREAWRQLLEARPGRMHATLTLLALFWADGQRSVLEIADLVELETGQYDVELLLSYFRLLEKLAFVAF
jgi:aminopeptidase YwaD